MTPSEERAYGALLKEAALYLLTPSEGVRAICRGRMAEAVEVLRMTTHDRAMGLRATVELALAAPAPGETPWTRDYRLRLVVAEQLAYRAGGGT